jgi:hypothetical protein
LRPSRRSKEAMYHESVCHEVSDKKLELEKSARRFWVGYRRVLSLLVSDIAEAGNVEFGTSWSSCSSTASSPGRLHLFRVCSSAIVSLNRWRLK